MVLWLNYQRQFYEIQPDRDEVLLPWSFKGEVYRQYKLNPTVGSSTIEIVHRDPCTLQYFLLVWKQDVPELKCRRFHRFMICDTCSNLPRGTDVTIECLHRTFLKLCAQGKLFPCRLNLQLDNTSKDNKARYLMAYLSC